MSAGYQLIGTPLDEEEDNLPGSMSYAQRLAPSLVEFQRARDEGTGKRRFEGAFRGGWERKGEQPRADPEEGWKPSAFVSSRERRADAGAAVTRLEDIMDEEDLVGIQTSRTGGSKQVQDHLDAEVVAIHRRGDAGGYTLLRAMGWKLGRKIGADEEEEVAANDRDVLLEGDRHVHGKHVSEKLSIQVAAKAEGLGKFHEDVNVRKADREGLGYRKIEFGEDDEDNVYSDNFNPEDYDTGIGGPAVVRGVVDGSEPGSDSAAASRDLLPDNPLIDRYVTGDRLTGSKVARRRKKRASSEDGEEDTGDANLRRERGDEEDVEKDPPLIKHNFETDKFKRDLALPSLLLDEAVKVKNAEQRRLVLGEKALARRRHPPPPSSHAAKNDEAETTTSNLRQQDPAKLLESYGQSVQSRFVSVGTLKEGPADKAVPETETTLQLNQTARSELWFQPCALLCKRFNVPQPDVNIAKIVATTGVKTSRFISAGLEFDQKVSREAQAVEDESKFGRETSTAEDEDEEELVAFEKPLDDEERPSAALFQAIFDDDDDEDVDEDNET